MSNITGIIDIVGIIVSVLIIIIVSDWSKDMDDSQNDQEVISDIRSGKIIPNPDNPRELIYADRARDSEVIWSSNDSNQEVENSEEALNAQEEFSDSDDSDDSTDNERDEFTLHDFYNKWQTQPCTSLEICEFEDDERRVGLRSGPLNKQELLFQPEETESKSSDDGDCDDYWKYVRKSRKWGCDDYWKYEPKETVTKSKQPVFYFDP